MKEIIKLEVKLTKEHLAFIKEYMEKYGFLSEEEAIRVIIAMAIKKEYPAYVKKRKTVEEKVKEKVELKKLGKDLVKQEKIDICKELGGTIYDGDGGHQYCEYTNFEEVIPDQITEYKVKEPLSLLNSELIALQYRTIEGKTGPEAKKKIAEILKIVHD